MQAWVCLYQYALFWVSSCTDHMICIGKTKSYQRKRSIVLFYSHQACHFLYYLCTITSNCGIHFQIWTKNIGGLTGFGEKKGADQWLCIPYPPPSFWLLCTRLSKNLSAVYTVVIIQCAEDSCLLFKLLLEFWNVLEHTVSRSSLLPIKVSKKTSPQFCENCWHVQLIDGISIIAYPLQLQFVLLVLFKALLGVKQNYHLRNVPLKFQ